MEAQHRTLTGRDLMAERIRRGLRGLDVAERLGVSRSRIGQIESSWRVRPQLAERYLEALTEGEPSHT